MARNYAVLGSPISHSKSPIIHQAAYRALGLNWTYEAIEVPFADFGRFLNTEGSKFDGFSITMPLKEIAFQSASANDDLASKSRLANTLVRSGSEWMGFNTDVFGVKSALMQANDLEVETAIILGTGATAKSSLIAVAQISQDAAVFIAGRSKEKISELCDYANEYGINAQPLSNSAIQADVTICTLPPETFVSLASLFPNLQTSGVLLDVAYAPWPSQAAKAWMQAGSPVVSGIEMLIWQAIGQIKLFTASSGVAFNVSDEAALAATMRSALL